MHERSVRRAATGGDGSRQRQVDWTRLAALAVAVALLGTLSCGDGPAAPPPPAPVAATVTVNPPSASLSAIGETVRLSADVRDGDGRALAGAAVSWSSSDASVAEVGTSGQVMAAGNGTATIRATTGSVSGTATVTVAQVVSTVALTPAADTLVEADTLRLSAQASDANGHAVEGAAFEWASSDTLVAVVDDSGLATGVAEGTATITATSSEVTGSAELTVAVPMPTTVAVSPDAVALSALGDTARLSARVFDQTGRPMAGAAISWSSSEASVATVDSSGLVTAEGMGSAMVRATSGEASGSAIVTVMQSADSVTVLPVAATIGPGDTLRLVAKAFDANGHPLAGEEFAWSSSDDSVATVDASGLVTGVGEGSTTIAALLEDARGTSRIAVVNPDRAALVALYEATDGPNWVNDDGWLTDAPLRYWYGVQTGRSGRVVSLSLSNNGLSGVIPLELSGLGRLRVLLLRGTDVCTPGVGRFVRWIDALEFFDGSYCNESDAAALESLYRSAGGTDWINSAGWLGGPALEEWHGVSADPLGRVAMLDLADNGLAGELPSTLGTLTQLTELRIGDNVALSGRLPNSLTRLSLSVLHYAGTNLCSPGDDSFRAWVRDVASHEGTDAECAPLSDRDVLAGLFRATGGANWIRSDNWLTDAPLEEWYAVEADRSGRVVSLHLNRNGLSGTIPPELGELASLKTLYLAVNDLSGPIPPELGGLTSLTGLSLAANDLSGPIPPELATYLPE